MKLLILFCLNLINLSLAENLSELRGKRFVLDLKYASSDNFLKKSVYRPFGITQCLIRPELKEKLEKLVGRLEEEKLKLIIWDCFRPLAVQQAMWKLVPDPRYVADPKVGSNHNRGAAIDLALSDEKGSILSFPTSFDDFSPKASPQYRCSSEENEKCLNRDKLIELMKSVGLEVFPTEWWHFQLPEAGRLPVLKNFESTK